MEEDVTQHGALVGYLHDLVCDHPNFEVLCEPMTDRYCFRYVPNGLSTDQHTVQQLLDELNREIVERVQREGFPLIDKVQVGNRVAIRISTGSYNIAREDMDATFEAIARCGRLLTRKERVLVS